MDLIIQVIMAILVWTLSSISGNFRCKLKKSTSLKEEEKYKKLSSLMSNITVLGFICTFIYILTSTTPITIWNTVIACIKISVVLIVENIVTRYFDSKARNKVVTFEDTLISVVIICFVMVVAMFVRLGINDSKYQKNIEYLEDVIYSKEEYILLPEFNEDTKQAQNDSSLFNSISKYFNYTGDSYGMYYEMEIDDKTEKIYKEYNQDDVMIVEIKENQEPYLEIRTHTKYAMDNNIEPAEKIIASEKKEYILHIFQEDINDIMALQKTE